MTFPLASFLIIPLLHAAPAAPTCQAGQAGPACQAAKPTLQAAKALPQAATPVAPGQLEMPKDPAAMKAKIRELAKQIGVRDNAPASQTSRFHWQEVPEQIDVTEVPGLVRSEGIPMKLLAARSRQKMDALVPYFYQRFVEAHLYVAPLKKQFQLPQVPMLTALDPKTEISYTVIFQPNRDGTTTVVMGEAHLGEKEEEPAGFDFAPVFPGAEDVVRTDVEGQRSLTFIANAKADEVERYYREVLGKAGAKEIRPGVFQQRDHELHLLSRPMDGQLAVSITERSASAVEPVGEQQP